MIQVSAIRGGLIVFDGVMFHKFRKERLELFSRDMKRFVLLHAKKEFWVRICKSHLIGDCFDFIGIAWNRMSKEVALPTPAILTSRFMAVSRRWVAKHLLSKQGVMIGIVSMGILESIA